MDYAYLKTHKKMSYTSF